MQAAVQRGGAASGLCAEPLIWHLWVRPSAQGRGWARQLLETAAQHARASSAAGGPVPGARGGEHVAREQEGTGLLAPRAGTQGVEEHTDSYARTVSQAYLWVTDELSLETQRAVSSLFKSLADGVWCYCYALLVLQQLSVYRNETRNDTNGTYRTSV